MVPKYVIYVSIIWLNDIYSRNTWFPTTDVQTQNIGKLWYANRRAPTECRHTVATQATKYQCWRDVGCRSRRCRPMPTLGQRRNASCEYSSIGSDNGLWPVRHQAIIWTKDGLVLWRIYASLSLNELSQCKSFEDRAPINCICECPILR